LRERKRKGMQFNKGEKKIGERAARKGRTTCSERKMPLQQAGGERGPAGVRQSKKRKTHERELRGLLDAMAKRRVLRGTIRGLNTKGVNWCNRIKKEV